MEKKGAVFSIIASLMVLFAALSWYFLSNFFENTHFFWAVFSCFFVFSVFTALSWLFIGQNSPARRFLPLVVVFSSFFSFYPKVFVFVVGVVSAVLIGVSFEKTASEKEERVKIDIFKIIFSGLPVFFTALSLLISCFFFVSFSQKDFSQKEILPRFVFDFAIERLEPEMKRAGIFPAEADLREKETSNAVYLEMEKRLKGVFSSKKTRDYILFSISLSLFFVLKTLSFILIFLVFFVVFVIFKLMVWMGAAKISYKSIEKEVIEI